MTEGGKSIDDHLEAVDHFKALQWMRAVAARPEPLDENVITEFHRRIVARSRPKIAGLYSRHARRVVGLPMIFPDAKKIPTLMETLGMELSYTDNMPSSAFDMHYRFVTIHPFDDGNGRTARMLMNLLLIRNGYIPVPIGPDDREEYRETLKTAQLAQDHTAPAFQAFMHRRLATTLQEYVRDLRQGHGDRENGGSTRPVAGADNARSQGEDDEMSPAEFAHLARQGGFTR